MVINELIDWAIEILNRRAARLMRRHIVLFPVWRASVIARRIKRLSEMKSQG